MHSSFRTRFTLALIQGLVLGGLILGCGEPPQKTAPQAGTQATAPDKSAPASFAAKPGGAGQAEGTSATAKVNRSVLPTDAPKDAEIVTDITPGKRGGKLVQAFLNENKSFNPLLPASVDDQYLTAWLDAALYNYDTWLQKEVPGLAKSWEYNDKTQEWTFHLREGMRWSDGRPLTADDFIFYSQVVFDPKVICEEKYAYQLNGKPFEFRAPDPLTLVVKIPGIDSFAFQAIGQVRPLPRHVLEKTWKAGRFMEVWGQNVKPAERIGSGPFKLKEIRPGEAVILERNPYYYRYDVKGQQLPYLDQVVINFAGSRDNWEVSFMAGAIDMIDQIRAESLPRMQDQAKAKDYTVLKLGPGLNIVHYWFNQTQGGTYTDAKGAQQVWRPSRMGEPPPAGLKNYKPFVDPIKASWFNNREFRIACSELTNRQQIIDNILYGQAVPLYGPESPANHIWTNPALPQFVYNPESAKKRLDKIGFIDRNGDGVREDPQGHPIRFTIYTNRENNTREKIIQMLAAEFQAAGLGAQAQVIDGQKILTIMQQSYDYDCTLFGLGSGVPPHPAMAFNTWLTSGKMHEWNPLQKAPGTAWEAQLDQMYGQLKQLFDPAAQRQVYFKMQAIYAEQQPTIPVYAENAFAAVKNNIGNLKPTVMRPFLTNNLDELYLK